MSPADSLKRDARGVREVVRPTGRATSFNDWHRASCAASSYICDIDGMIYRYRSGVPVVVALLEHKAWHVTESKYVLSASTRATYELSKLAGCKFWFIWYAPDLSMFRVWSVSRYPCFDPELETYKRVWFLVTPERMRLFIDRLK